MIDEPCPRGFSFYHVPRANRRGGDVGLIFSKSLKILKVEVEIFRSFKVMEVLLYSSSLSLPIRILILYRLHHNKKKNLTADIFFFKIFHSYLNA